MTSDRQGAMGAMKPRIFLLVVCVATFAYAKAMTPAQLAEAVFVDTEVSTNTPPPTCEGDPHHVSFTLEFTGTPSNAVEIAFGIDVNSDGALTPNEAKLVIGWECGAWFIRNENNGVTVAEPATNATGAQTLQVTMRVGRDGLPTSFVVRSGNSPRFVGFASAPPAWLHDCTWNLCRLTARGVDAHDASFLVSATPDGTTFILR